MSYLITQEIFRLSLSTALALDQGIHSVRQDNWRGNLFKERRVRNALLVHISSEAEQIFDLVKNQKEY